MSGFDAKGGHGVYSATGNTELFSCVPATNRDGFPHSDEQAEILNFVQQETRLKSYYGNPLKLSISAVAGSGKTTTVECIMKMWANMGYGEHNVIATAFNKHIAEALLEVGTSLKASGLTGFTQLGRSNTANAGGRSMIFDYIKSNGMTPIDDRDGNKYRNLSRIQLSMTDDLKNKLSYATDGHDTIKNEIAGWMAGARGIEKGVTACMAGGVMIDGDEPALEVVELLSSRYGRDDDIVFAKALLGELEYADAVVSVIADGIKCLNPVEGVEGYGWSNYRRTATADCIVPNSVTGYYNNRSLVSIRQLFTQSDGQNVFNALGMSFGGEKVPVAFQDHIYAPVALNLRYGKRISLLIVDEVQDFSVLQGRFLNCFINEDTNIVIVGDIRQSLYLFNHADSAATRKLVETYDCVEMPMTICWRNSMNVEQDVHRFMKSNMDVALMKGYTEEKLLESGMGDYSAHRTPEGDWREGQKAVMMPAHLLPYAAQHGDLVTCRINAPLAKLALRTLIDGEKSITLPGGNSGIDKMVMSIFRGAKKHRGAWVGFDLMYDRDISHILNHDVVEDRLSSFLDSNLEAAERRCGGDLQAAKREQRYCDLRDKAEATAEILHGYIDRVETPTIRGFEGWLTSLCGTTEGRTGHDDTIRFASVHRTKGAQGPVAFIVIDKVIEDGLQSTFMLDHCMKDAPEVIQELNACYVAVTRAIDRVVYVTCDPALADKYPTWDSYQSAWNGNQEEE